MIRKQSDLPPPKVVPSSTPRIIKPDSWRELPQPDMTINEFLEKHPPEELYKLSDAQLSSMLAPYFPFVRRAMLPVDKPRKVGVEARAMMDAVEKNKDAINAMLVAMGKKKI